MFRLTEKPAGRQPIDTRTILLDRIGEVADGVGRRSRAAARLLGLSPDRGVGGDRPANVEERSPAAGALSGKVGLLHGRLKGAERGATMMAFAEGRLSPLVATTVIEVGVAVPAGPP